MRILFVNKFHYLKGGSEKYYFELAALMKEKGHEIAFFSMKNDKNISTGEKEYFVDEIDLNTGSKLKAFSVIYSKTNYKKMIEAIEDFKPDIIHVNNFQRQLSASIIRAANKKKIPIVFTAHDVQAICPAITMLDNQKNICEKCMHGKYYNCAKKKCNKNSLLKSCIGAIEGYYYRFNKIYTKKIDKIVTPSEFYRTKLIEDGISSNKTITLHNFIDAEQYDVPIEDSGYALYLGRLSEEKGIYTLIKAFEKTDNGKLYIAGDGPEKENIIKFINENKLNERIKLLGFINKDQVKDMVRKSRFVVIPSIWYENCPYSVLETMAIGKPVIGANIGGIPELVKDNETGLLFSYTDYNDLTNKMNTLFNNSELAFNLGNNAKSTTGELYSKEKYYNDILKIYKECLEEKKNG